MIKVKVTEFPLNAEVVFRRRNEQCVNLYVVNEDKTEQYICFFNIGSRYAKDLEKRYSIDFTKLFQ